jgi:tRNA/rRNA methyltransferase
MPRLAESLATGPAALVFGPEPNGLTNDEATRCHFLIHIPADPTYPALNLAQAVAVCLYELRRAWLRCTTDPPLRPPAAPFAMQERMFTQMHSALERIHFLYGEKGDALMHAFRHLIGRAGPTEMEVDVLFGLARQIHWFVDHHAGKPAESE